MNSDPAKELEVKNENQGISKAGEIWNGLLHFCSGVSEDTYQAIQNGNMKPTLDTLTKFFRYERGMTLKDRLWRAVKDKIQQGEARDGYSESEQVQSCFVKVVEIIEEQAPEEVKFKTIQALFLTIMCEDCSFLEDRLPKSLLDIAEKLSENALIILFINYKLWKQRDKNSKRIDRLYTWADLIANESIAFKDLRDIILHHEKELVEYRLLFAPDVRPAINGILVSAETLRLTPLGVKFCEYVNSSADPLENLN